MKKLLVSQGWGEEKFDAHIEMLIDEGDASDLDPIDGVILRYARKLTLDPSKIDKADIDELRQHGASDSAIHDLCAIVSYFNFVNRIADGLGVELEGL